MFIRNVNLALLLGSLMLLSACQSTSPIKTQPIGQEPIRVNPVNVQNQFITKQAITPQALDISSGNLFDNSGFESELEGWTACSDGAITTSTDAFEGSGALEVVPNNCFYRSAEVSSGQDLVLSCYAKITSGSGWTDMGIGFADSSWTTIAEAPTTVITSSDYARYDITFTTPANTKYASMWLYSENPVVIDNCSLILETTPPPPPLPSGDNLLENGDFESLDGTNNPTDWSIGCGGSWNVSSDYSNELSLTGGACVDQSLSSGDIAALSGQEYTYSCYATNNGGYASLSIFFDDVPMTIEIPEVTYQLIELKGTAPQASSGFVSIYSEADLTIDDCSISIENTSSLIETKLTASDATTEDRFGNAVAISGNFAIVGAELEESNSAPPANGSSGAAYVYRQTAGQWVEEVKLTASDADFGDLFGTSVAIEGNLAVIGAKHNSDAGRRSGSAYVFRYTNGQWIEEAKLTASDAAEGDFFGHDVAISDETILISGYSNDDIGSASGSAYVFQYTNGQWIEEAKLTASDATSGDLFGYALDIDNDTIVIGAYRKNDDEGAAYVFKYVAGQWVEETTLTYVESTFSSPDFAQNIAIKDSVIVASFVGTETETGQNFDIDIGIVFRYQDGQWIHEARLARSFGSLLGLQLDTTGDTIVLGEAYYEYRNGSWVETGELVGSDVDGGDQFALSRGAVAISGKSVIIGSFKDDDAGSNSGSAYIFELP